MAVLICDPLLGLGPACGGRGVPKAGGRRRRRARGAAQRDRA